MTYSLLEVPNKNYIFVNFLSIVNEGYLCFASYFRKLQLLLSATKLGRLCFHTYVSDTEVGSTWVPGQVAT